jgi:hypothetical protein
MRRALVATGAARWHAAPGSLRAWSTEAAGGAAGEGRQDADAGLPPRGRGRGAPLDAPPGAGAPRASRGRGRAESGGLLSRVLGDAAASAGGGASRAAGETRARSAPPPGALAPPPPPRAPREGPPREFTSRRVAASPTGQPPQQAGRPAWREGGGMRARSPPGGALGGAAGRGACRPHARLRRCRGERRSRPRFLRRRMSDRALTPPAPLADADTARPDGGAAPERRRSRWQAEAAEFTARRESGPGARAPSAQRPRGSSPAGREAMEAAARARVARHRAPRRAAADFDEAGVAAFVQMALDTHLDTSDVGHAPQLWDAAPQLAPEQLLQAAGAEMRSLAGVADDAEWAALCAEALDEWRVLEAAQRAARLKAGGSDLPHVAAEDAALAALAAGAAGGAGGAFAAKACATLTHNPRWGFAAKQRALSLIAARAGH